jgi:hypothetical protein
MPSSTSLLLPLVLTLLNQPIVELGRVPERFSVFALV